MTLHWSTLANTPGRTAILPDGRIAHVGPARSGSGYAARLCRRPGAVPYAVACYVTEAEAVAWVERLAVRSAA